MPAAYAHIMATDRALGRFRAEASIELPLRNAGLHFSHFARLGAISPDYPYLDFPAPAQKAWADHMHYDQTGDMIRTMAERLLEVKGGGVERPEFGIPFAWTLGYIGHVTADLVVHPVVRNIVGDYLGHEPDHRECEMIQDTYIYHEVRGGAEIQHSALLDTLKNCSDPANADRIHPILRAFWSEVFRRHFPEQFGACPPAIDEWHDRYEDFLGLAGRPGFLGRVLDPKHKYTYRLTTEITAAERTRSIDALPLPTGITGTYQTLFEKAVREVTAQWLSLARGLATGKLDAFLSGTLNCNLDTGETIGLPKLRYWA
jgi:hypothetical protein